MDRYLSVNVLDFETVLLYTLAGLKHAEIGLHCPAESCVAVQRSCMTQFPPWNRASSAWPPRVLVAPRHAACLYNNVHIFYVPFFGECSPCQG